MKNDEFLKEFDKSQFDADHMCVTPSGISDKVNALHSLNTPSS